MRIPSPGSSHLAQGVSAQAQQQQTFATLVPLFCNADKLVLDIMASPRRADSQSVFAPIDDQIKILDGIAPAKRATASDFITAETQQPGCALAIYIARLPVWQSPCGAQTASPGDPTRIMLSKPCFGGREDCHASTHQPTATTTIQLQRHLLIDRQYGSCVYGRCLERA